MDRDSYAREMTRRGFVVSLGPGMYVLGMAVANGAPLKKVPTATGIDALYVPFVVAAELKIFEKYGLETSYKPFDDGNVALDALLTGSSDIGATTELGGSRVGTRAASFTSPHTRRLAGSRSALLDATTSRSRKT